MVNETQNWFPTSGMNENERYRYGRDDKKWPNPRFKCHYWSCLLCRMVISGKSFCSLNEQTHTHKRETLTETEWRSKTMKYFTNLNTSSRQPLSNICIHGSLRNSRYSSKTKDRQRPKKPRSQSMTSFQPFETPN